MANDNPLEDFRNILVESGYMSEDITTDDFSRRLSNPEARKQFRGILVDSGYMSEDISQDMFDERFGFTPQEEFDEALSSFDSAPEKQEYDIPVGPSMLEPSVTDGEFQEGEPIPIVSDFANAIIRGEAIARAQANLDAYTDMTPEELEEYAKAQADAQKYEASEEYREFGSAQNMEEAWDIFKKAPLKILAEVVGESSSMFFIAGWQEMALAAGAGIIAPPSALPAGMLAVGKTSFDLEYTGTFTEAMQEEGYDVTNPEDVKKALEDEEFVDRVRNKALKRGLTVGLVDAATLGIAQKIGASRTVRKLLGRRGRTLSSGLTEAGGGGVGEIAGSVAVGDQPTFGEVALEVIGEGPGVAYNSVIAKQLSKSDSHNEMAAAIVEGDKKDFAGQLDFAVESGMMGRTDADILLQQWDQMETYLETLPEGITSKQKKKEIISLITERERLKNKPVDEVFFDERQEEIENVNKKIADVVNRINTEEDEALNKAREEEIIDEEGVDPTEAEKTPSEASDEATEQVSETTPAREANQRFVSVLEVDNPTDSPTSAQESKKPQKEDKLDYQKKDGTTKELTYSEEKEGWVDSKTGRKQNSRVQEIANEQFSNQNIVNEKAQESVESKRTDASSIDDQGLPQDRKVVEKGQETTEEQTQVETPIDNTKTETDGLQETQKETDEVLERRESEERVEEEIVSEENRINEIEDELLTELSSLQSEVDKAGNTFDNDAGGVLKVLDADIDLNNKKSVAKAFGQMGNLSKKQKEFFGEERLQKLKDLHKEWKELSSNQFKKRKAAKQQTDGPTQQDTESTQKADKKTSPTPPTTKGKTNTEIRQQGFEQINKGEYQAENLINIGSTYVDKGYSAFKGEVNKNAPEVPEKDIRSAFKKAKGVVEPIKGDVHRMGNTVYEYDGEKWSRASGRAVKANTQEKITQDFGKSIIEYARPRNIYQLEKALGLVFGFPPKIAKMQAQIMDRMIKSTIKGKRTQDKIKKAYKDHIELLVSAPTEDMANDDLRFSLVGEGANLSDNAKQSLLTAVQMEKEGKDSNTVFRATGWERSPADGKWRYDVTDNIEIVGEITEEPKNLEEVVNTNLYEYYPELRKVKIKSAPLPGRTAAATDGGVIIIWEPNMFGLTTPRLAILEEMQHNVQRQEGFPVGGNENTVLLGAAGIIGYDPRRVVEGDMENELFLGLANRFLGQDSGDTREGKIVQAAVDQLEGRVTGEENYERLAGELEATQVLERDRMSESVRQMFPPSQNISSIDPLVIYSDDIRFDSPSPAQNTQPALPEKQLKQYQERVSKGKLKDPIKEHNRQNEIYYDIMYKSTTDPTLKEYYKTYRDLAADGVLFDSPFLTNNQQKENLFIKNFLNGTETFEFLSGAENEGIRRGGKIHAETELFTISNGISTESNQGDRKIEKWAKEKGYWIDESEIPSEDAAHYVGSESLVMLQPDEGSVRKYKLPRFGFNTVAGLVRSLTYHNTLFPETAYKLVGFSKNPDGRLIAVIDQPFIINEAKSSWDNPLPEEYDILSKHLSGLGFNITDITEAERDERGVSVGDMQIPENVHIFQGNVYIVDPVIKVRDDFNLEEASELLNSKISSIRLDSPRNAPRGAYDISQRIMYALFNPSILTPIHELAHAREKFLNEDQKNDVLNWAEELTGNEYPRANINDENYSFPVEVSELFARGLEQYLKDGQATEYNLTNRVKQIFEQFKEWLNDLKVIVNGMNLQGKLNEPMKKIYDQILDLEQDKLNVPDKFSAKNAFVSELLENILGETIPDTKRKSWETTIQNAINYGYIDTESNSTEKIMETAITLLATGQVNFQHLSEIEAGTAWAAREIGDLISELRSRDKLSATQKRHLMSLEDKLSVLTRANNYIGEISGRTLSFRRGLFKSTKLNKADFIATVEDSLGYKLTEDNRKYIDSQFKEYSDAVVQLKELKDRAKITTSDKKKKEASQSLKERKKVKDRKSVEQSLLNFLPKKDIRFDSPQEVSDYMSNLHDLAVHIVRSGEAKNLEQTIEAIQQWAKDNGREAPTAEDITTALVIGGQKNRQRAISNLQKVKADAKATKNKLDKLDRLLSGLMPEKRRNPKRYPSTIRKVADTTIKEIEKLVNQNNDIPQDVLDKILHNVYFIQSTIGGLSTPTNFSDEALKIAIEQLRETKRNLGISGAKKDQRIKTLDQRLEEINNQIKGISNGTLSPKSILPDESKGIYKGYTKQDATIAEKELEVQEMKEALEAYAEMIELESRYEKVLDLMEKMYNVSDLLKKPFAKTLHKALEATGRNPQKWNLSKGNNRMKALRLLADLRGSAKNWFADVFINLLAMYDLSMMGLQAGKFLLKTPGNVAWGLANVASKKMLNKQIPLGALAESQVKAFWDGISAVFKIIMYSFPDMITDTVGGVDQSRTVANKVYAAIMTDPDIAMLVDLGKLEITKPGTRGVAAEEFFRSGLVERLPLIGQFSKTSEEVFSTYMNIVRAYEAKKFLADMGPYITSKKDLEAIGGLVNALTGRARIIPDGAGTFLSKILFAPKWMASKLWTTFKFMNPLSVTYNTVQGLRGDRMKLIKAVEAARMYGVTATLLFALQALGAKIDFDCQSNEFLRIKLGTGRLDMGNMIAPYLKVFCKLSGLHTADYNIAKQGRKREFDGLKLTVDELLKGANPLVSITGNAIIGKELDPSDENPYQRLQSMALFRKDFFGKPYHPDGRSAAMIGLSRQVTPIAITNTAELVNGEMDSDNPNYMQSLMLSLGGFLGLGAFDFQNRLYHAEVLEGFNEIDYWPPQPNSNFYKFLEGFEETYSDLAKDFFKNEYRKNVEDEYGRRVLEMVKQRGDWNRMNAIELNALWEELKGSGELQKEILEMAAEFDMPYGGFIPGVSSIASDVQVDTYMNSPAGKQLKKLQDKGHKLTNSNIQDGYDKGDKKVYSIGPVKVLELDGELFREFGRVTNTEEFINSLKGKDDNDQIKIYNSVRTRIGDVIEADYLMNIMELADINTRTLYTKMGDSDMFKKRTDPRALIKGVKRYRYPSLTKVRNYLYDNNLKIEAGRLYRWGEQTGWVLYGSAADEVNE